MNFLYISLIDDIYIERVLFYYILLDISSSLDGPEIFLEILPCTRPKFDRFFLGKLYHLSERAKKKENL